MTSQGFTVTSINAQGTDRVAAVSGTIAHNDIEYLFSGFMHWDARAITITDNKGRIIFSNQNVVVRKGIGEDFDFASGALNEIESALSAMHELIDTNSY